MRFKGKRALVTGAAGGIGNVLVQALMTEGAIVFATDKDTSLVNATHCFDADLTNSNQVEEMINAANNALGGLDFVCNNAGIITRGDIIETSDEDFRLTMSVNVEAPFRICRASIPIMAKNGGGAIVNTSSCWGLRPGPNHPLYIMSKAAIASLTQCLGRDHAHQNIRVNAVCPNEVDTAMLRSGFSARGLDPEKGIEELNATVPLGRIATPDDIVDVILFLLSEDARYMCGSLVEVNGGKPVI